MEHILQFAIGIDDEAIRRRVEESAYKDVVKALTDDAVSALPKRYGGAVDWRNLVDGIVADFLERYKPEIVDAAACKLHESMRRTKAVKDAIEKAVAE